MANDVKFAISEAQRRVEKPPTGSIEPPRGTGSLEVDPAVANVFPVPGTKLIRALHYAESQGSRTAKLVVELPDKTRKHYFLKVVVGETGLAKCKGEFKSLEAIHEVSPGFAPFPYGWGRFKTPALDGYFLLEEFIEISRIPADPDRLTTRLADLHSRSQSPTGKFGFHVKTWHGNVAQRVDQWEDSWAVMFGRHLRHIVELAKPLVSSSEFDILCSLILDKVVPRLLCPLQENGRALKPSLVHGDCWDGNTAIDHNVEEARIFDVCSFYGHNEYDTGNWRALRHRLSDNAYVLGYKRNFPASEPAEEWSARNILYSLCFNLGNLINIPGSQQGEVAYNDMVALCKVYCPNELEKCMEKPQPTQSNT